MRRATIEQMRQLATERCGACLSSVYCGDAVKLHWQCMFGHQWDAQPTKVKQGRWCPQCSQGLSERIVRLHFETLLGAPFPRTRPSWLRPVDRRPLELDGFNSELMLAFEHDGVQHFEPVKHFGGEEMFEIRRRDDKEKDRLCVEHGVVLVRVPALGARLHVAELKPFIVACLSVCGFALPGVEAEVLWQNVYHCEPAKERLVELQRVATVRSGRLLSDTYLGHREPLEWECAAGHRWRAVPGSVKNNKSWCRRCAGYEKKSLNEVAETGANVGLVLLSKEYHSAHGKLKWTCKFGHDLRKTYASVRDGHGCYLCRGGVRPVK